MGEASLVQIAWVNTFAQRQRSLTATASLQPVADRQSRMPWLLDWSPFVCGTDAEQTLHSRCVDVEASGRLYTVIKNSVIACGLFPLHSLFLLILFSPWAQSILFCALFSIRTTALFGFSFPFYRVYHYQWGSFHTEGFSQCILPDQPHRASLPQPCIPLTVYLIVLSYHISLSPFFFLTILNS